jgi:hypothetical protein
MALPDIIEPILDPANFFKSPAFPINPAGLYQEPLPKRLSKKLIYFITP